MGDWSPSDWGDFGDASSQLSGGIQPMSNSFLGISPSGWAGAGLSGVAGAVPQNGTQTTNSNSNSILNSLQNLFGTSNTNTNQSGTTSGTTTTGYGAAGDSLISTLLPHLNSLLGSSTDLSPYLSNQVANINNNTNAAQTNLNQQLAARGLSTSPAAAAAAAKLQSGRTAQISQVQSQIPLLQQQLQTQNLGTAANILNALPRTSTNTGATTNTGTTGTTNNQTSQANQTQDTTQNSTTKTSSGGGWLGALTGIASGLAAAL